MTQLETEIKKIMATVLRQYRPSGSFEALWNRYCSQKRPFQGLKIIRVPALILLSLLMIYAVGFVSSQVQKQVDRTDYPFITDRHVIGRWETVDFVQKISDFHPGKKAYSGDLYLSTLVFIKNGRMLSALENERVAESTFSWTKGKILCKREQTASNYKIKQIARSTYLFFQWKNGDYQFFWKKPCYYVLKKVVEQVYSDYQINRVMTDQVDYPFSEDVKMHGNWQSVDFVAKPEDFRPEIKSYLDTPFVIGISVRPQGQVTFKTTSGEVARPTLRWTAGLIIDEQSKTASKCLIKEMNGATYLFYQWKSGDYIFRGREPRYYVLRKTE